MPVFHYNGLSEHGKDVKGEIDAETPRAAREKLRKQGIYPTNLDEVTKKKKSDNLSLNIKREKASTMQLAVLTRQLATLLGSGMPLVDSLRALADQQDKPILKQTVTSVREKVNEGISFHQALEAHPKIFPKLFVKMIRSGESSGTLDLVLDRLAETLENQAILNRKIISSITYPVLMIFLCFAVIGILLGFVVPEISQIFKDKGDELPFATQVVVDMSNFLRYYWLLLVGVGVFSGIAFKKYINTKKGRYNFDKFKVEAPVIGPITLKLATARLATNLGTMLQSGIELLTALTISKDILANTYLEETIIKATDGVSEGKSLSVLLSQSDRFPKLLVHLTAVGEQTGDLDKMLMRVGKAFEMEVESVISALTSILEPVLIIFLAVVVGGILLAVMSPMLDLTAIGN